MFLCGGDDTYREDDREGFLAKIVFKGRQSFCLFYLVRKCMKIDPHEFFRRQISIKHFQTLESTML